MNFVQSNNITGSHIQDAIKYYKMDVGYGGTLFENKYHTLKHCITPTWISYSWQFMWGNNILIQEGTPLLKLQRKNDSLLIENYIMTGSRDNKLAEINICHIFLQVS